MADDNIQCRRLTTPCGTLAFAARGATVVGLILPDRDKRRLARDIAARWPAARPSADLLPGLARQIRDYFAGRSARLSARVDLGARSAFERRVLRSCRAIPAGRVMTYGELAGRAGCAGAAQAVGRALARNPAPLVIPCHRVVAAGGGLCGFSAAGGLTLKRRLLDHEKRWRPAGCETRRRKT